jgi:hypothetical protein
VIIALSGSMHDDAEAQSFAAGFDHHVMKPADIENLERLFPVHRLEATSRDRRA